MRVPSASTSVWKRMPRRARSLNLPPRSTCITDPIARVAGRNRHVVADLHVARDARFDAIFDARRFTRHAGLGLQSDHRIGRDDELRERARGGSAGARRFLRGVLVGARRRRRALDDGGAGGGGGCAVSRPLLVGDGAGSRCAAIGGAAASCGRRWRGLASPPALPRSSSAQERAFAARRRSRPRFPARLWPVPSPPPAARPRGPSSPRARSPAWLPPEPGPTPAPEWCSAASRDSRRRPPPRCRRWPTRRTRVDSKALLNSLDPAD